MAKNSITSLEITNDTIANILDSIVLSEEPAITRLIYDMICTSPNAAKWFVDFALGRAFPWNIDPGTQGYIKVSSLRWHTYVSDYEKSNLVQHGYIPCVIKKFNGLHEYNPLTILLPDVDGVPEDAREHGCKLDDFQTGTIHEDLIERDELPF